MHFLWNWCENILKESVGKTDAHTIVLLYFGVLKELA